MIRFFTAIVLAFFVLLVCPAPTVKPSIDACQASQSREIAGHSVLKVFPSDYPYRTSAVFKVPVQIIFQDSKGIFWFGSDHGLCSYDERQQRWTDYTNALGKWSLIAIQTIGESRQGMIWIHYSPYDKFAFLEGNRWRNVTEIAPPTIKSFGREIIFGKDGRIWFLSPEGLIAYDGSAWTGPFHPPEASVQTHNGFKLTYTDKRRAEVETSRDRARQEIGEEGPPVPLWTYEVQSSFQDRDGDIWLGAKRGIWRFEERTNRWSIYPMNGLVGVVGRIFEDRNGRIWFADLAAHLTMYDKRKNIWTYFDLQFEDAVVRAIYVDKQGQVLIGAELGVIVLDEHTKKNTQIPVIYEGQRGTGIWSIAEDREGRIWMGSYEGIFVLKP